MSSTSRPAFFRTHSSQSTKSTSSNIPSSSPKKNKPRLYLALYARGGDSSTSSFKSHSSCDSYHWSLQVGPSTNYRSSALATRYHIAHSPLSSEPFLYEECDLTSPPHSSTLIRVAIAKVRCLDTLISTLRSIPIPSSSEDPTYSCLTWTRAAFVALHDKDNKCLKSYLSPKDWKDVEACARKFVRRKRERRRFTTEGLWDEEKVATYNYWEHREVCL